MSKRLTLVLLAAAVVAFIATPAFAAVQNVKVSGDLEVMPLRRTNWDLAEEPNGATLVDLHGDETAILSFLRLRVDADLTDNVSITARLLSERDWNTETAAGIADNSDVDIDLASVTLKEFLYSPLTLTLGRQELHIGSELILGDPDANSTAVGTLAVQPDLSKRKAFDAIKATLDYSPLVVDVIYAKIAETTHSVKDDVDLYGVYATYDIGDDWSSIADLYYFDRKRGKSVLLNTAGSNKGENTHVIGGRIVTNPIENLTYSTEAAYQFGEYEDTDNSLLVDRKAYAFETAATYAWPRARYTPTLTGVVAMFTGNDDGWDALLSSDDDYQAWDPMYENQSFGDIACALLPQSNIYVLGLISTAELADDINAKLSYYSYLWVEKYGVDSTIVNTLHDSGVNLVMTDERDAGQEVDIDLTYDYTEDVQIGLKAGWFFPGDAFNSDNSDIASQVIGSMKVAF